MAVNVKISQFEGPLDLLLHLIAKAELDISEIAVHEVTAQYMDYMGQLDELDMDSASEFIAMAATLLYIKSRALLPRPRPVVEDEEDPEQALLRQIREYKIYKEAGVKLKEMLDSSGAYYGKLREEYPLPEQGIELGGVTAQVLFLEFQRLLKRQKLNVTPVTREVVRDAYSITDRMEHIRLRLRDGKLRGGRIRFRELFTGAAASQLVPTFMALLELLAAGEIAVEQDETFGEITIAPREHNR